MNFDLTEDEIKFLKTLAHELSTQSNRGTASPYFYTVRQTKRIVGMAPGYADNDVWVDCQNDYQEYPSREAAVESLMKDASMGQEEAEDYVDSHFEEFGVHEYDYNTNIFLTYQGFLDHMRLNGHNYSHSINSDKYTKEDDLKRLGGVYSYVDYAARNPELKKVIEILKKIGGQL